MMPLYHIAGISVARISLGVTGDGLRAQGAGEDLKLKAEHCSNAENPKLADAAQIDGFDVSTAQWALDCRVLVTSLNDRFGLVRGPCSNEGVPLVGA